MKLLFASILLSMMSLSPAAAEQPPWKVPESNFGGAVPLNLEDWYRGDDYPAAAAYDNQQGFVTVSFMIGTDGRISGCQVVRSSGHPILDAIPCKVLPGRARFTPAKNANGVAVVTHGSTSMSFWTSD